MSDIIDSPEALRIVDSYRAIGDTLAKAADEIAKLREQADKVATQRDALFHEVEAMRAKAPPCIDCAAKSDEVAKLRAENEALRVVADEAKGLRDWFHPAGGMSAALAALARLDAARKEAADG